MQILVFIVGAIAWLVIFWTGSIAFESTGMERNKARFQALSAITGTGFTTSEAESVVNHPKRRKIATRLMFFGTTGLIGFIIAIILFVRAGLEAPSPFYIIGIVITVVTIVLLIKLGAINRVTTSIVRLMRKPSSTPYVAIEEIIHQTGHYGVMRMAVGEQIAKTGLTLKDTDLKQREITILAIERKDTVIPFPSDDEVIHSGDYLLCYGKVLDMT